ncbi:MAG: bifunctional oligoribonuclease/PAP phosphatase NrnA [Clostridiales bacterium]|nr:bifunctional oligoribonuclease/PAP phosphatase NrnA [Clostridiales bacterium]
MNNSFDEIIEEIENSQNIAVAGHISPDGDAVASCCALAMALEKKGKTVDVLLEPVPEKFKSIPYSDKVINTVPDNDFDLFISLDCGDESRLGERAELIKRTFTINIDHHVSNTYFGRLNFVDGDASSTSELIYRLLDGWCNIDRDIAYALYTGIIFDTGCFKHSSTSPFTMQIAGELMTYNIPFTEIQERFFYSHTAVEAKLLGTAIDNMVILCGGRLAVSKLSIDEMAKHGGSSKDADAIVSYIKNTDGVDAAVFFYEKGPGEIKASMRSNEAVNVSQIAIKFGGGGHVMASGCTLHGKFEDVMPPVVDELIKALEG